MDFSSESKINKEHLSKQNKAIYEHLANKKTLTTLQAISDFGVTRLASRIFELRKMITVYDKFIDVDGIKVKQYSMFSELL